MTASADWGEDELAYLRELVASHGLVWIPIAVAMRERFPGRRRYSTRAISQRWLRYEQPNSEAVRTGRPWTPDECALLLDLHSVFGRDLTVIIGKMRERFGDGRVYTPYA